MTTTRTEYWSVDGVSLETYAYGLEVITESGVGSLVGADSSLAQRHGDSWNRKWRTAKGRTLAMWVTDWDVDEVLSGTADGRRTQRNENMLTLNRIFGKTKSQIQVIHRVRLTAGVLNLTGDAEVRKAYDFLAITDLGDSAQRFIVELWFADPYMYEDQVSGSSIAISGTTDYNDIGGSADTRRMDVVLTGPLTDPVLTNTINSVSVTYTGVIDSGKSVTIDVYNGTATHSTDGDVLTNVTHMGDPAFMVLEPVANILDLNVSAGSGSAAINYRAAHH